MKPSLAELTLLGDAAFRRLKSHVIASTGLAYYADKDHDLATRVLHRLEIVGLTGCASYLALLQDGQQGEAELDALITELTIGETFFFRHREMFDALRDLVLPELLQRNRERRQLRVWSAGCSTGAEAYSISILLRRELGDRVAGWDITILGTDINREFLARARDGIVEEWALRSTSDEIKNDCFVPAGDKSWLLKPQFRTGVSFQYHNLAVHPFPSLVNNLFAFDLILCRNVTIYFHAEIVRKIVDHFYDCLVEGGWLGVGHAEPNTEHFRAFRTINAPGAILYQKRQGSECAAMNVGATAPAANWSTILSTWQPFVFPESAAPEVIPPPVPQPMVSSSMTQANAGLDAVRHHADRGDWAKAAACCEQLLATNRLNPSIYLYQALILEQLGCHLEAEGALRRTLYLDRQFILGHYYLGLLLQKQGNVSQAARSFKNVRQLLQRLPAEHVFADGDGITAAELDKLTHMHLDVLEIA